MLYVRMSLLDLQDCNCRPHELVWNIGYVLEILCGPQSTRNKTVHTSLHSLIGTFLCLVLRCPLPFHMHRT